MSNFELKVLGTSANGINVYAHPEGHSHRPDLDAEAIEKIILPENETFFRGTIDMGRIIGKDHLVETTDEDIIYYLQRGNRPGKSRMVLKDADNTSFVTIIACVAREEEETPEELVGKWILITLFEGKPGEREPFDRSFTDGKNPEGKKAAEEFWACHALVPTYNEYIDILKENKVDVYDIENIDDAASWTIYEYDRHPHTNDVWETTYETKEEAVADAAKTVAKNNRIGVESIVAD